MPNEIDKSEAPPVQEPDPDKPSDPGEITAVGAGRAYVTVTIGGVSNQVLVRVRNS